MKWPDRSRIPSMRLLVVAWAVSLSLTTLYSLQSFFGGVAEPMRPDSFSAEYLLTVTASLIVGAAAEEVMCRVLLLTALVGLTRSRVDALTFSAVAFGLFHVPGTLVVPMLHGGEGNVPSLASAALGYAPAFLGQVGLGLFLGALWLRTGSITLIITSHALFNAGLTLALGV